MLDKKRFYILKANPYHDKLGKFTFKKMSGSTKSKSLKSIEIRNGTAKDGEQIAKNILGNSDHFYRVIKAFDTPNKFKGELRSGVYQIVINKEKQAIKYKGFVYDKNNNTVGEFIRTLSKNDLGSEMRHDAFVMYDTQGSGFGREFYRQSEETYMSLGINRVSLEANLEVGGYAWARMGFDFDKPLDPIKAMEMEQKFMESYEERHGQFPSNDQVPQISKLKPWEIAALKIEGESEKDRIGKQLLLGSKWDGVKRLDKSDEGYQVGQMYYNSK